MPADCFMIKNVISLLLITIISCSSVESTSISTTKPLVDLPGHTDSIRTDIVMNDSTAVMSNPPQTPWVIWLSLGTLCSILVLYYVRF